MRISPGRAGCASLPSSIGMNYRVVCVGEVMIELSLQSERSKVADLGVAGDVYNTAVYLKRQAPELTVEMVTRLGQDGFSERIRSAIRTEKLGIERIGLHPRRGPGLYAAVTDRWGERSFTYWRHQSAARTLFQEGQSVSFASLESADMIFLSAITLAILPVNVRSALIAWLGERRRTHGIKVVFDSNFRRNLWPSIAVARQTIADMWDITDIALPSFDDECALHGCSTVDAAIARLRSSGVETGAMKCGLQGPRSLSEPSVQTAFEPAPNVVDTTAAGDSFNAGYIGTLLTGGSEAEALLAGHELAVRVIGHHGAIMARSDRQ